MIRVLIVDDHAVVRRGLEDLFATTDDIAIVGMATNGREAIEQASVLCPDVILMDLSMPEIDGVTATRAITSAHADANVVVLTSFGENARILEALNAGAVGYLLKHADPDQIIAGIRAAVDGGSVLDPKAARALLNSRRSQPRVELTDREAEVLALVSEGLANKQIARRLGIAERTVKAHLGHVFQRIGVTDRTSAALWARDNLHNR